MAVSPRPAHSFVRDLAIVGLAGTVCIALVGGAATARIWQRGQLDEARPVDAIVVLGAAQYDGRPSGVLAARLDHAVRLWQAGNAPYLVLTGGNREGDRTTEAAVGRDYALARGVPSDALLFEDHGRSTLESLQAVAQIMREHGLRSALFVSDRTHMLRVIRIARDLGIEAYGSPTPSSPTDADPSRAFEATLHELGGLAWYELFGTSGPDSIEPGA